MKKVGRIVLYVLAALLLILLFGPLVIPIPKLEGTTPAQELADPDSQFIPINGLQVHVKTAGQGEPAIVLLHGFGASVFSWREVMQPLAETGASVMAFDRPAYGLTSRPTPGGWDGDSPYSPQAQIDLTIGLLDHFGWEQAILMGNSAGGTLATQVALEHPERVQALVLVDAAVYTTGHTPAWLGPILRTPQMRRIGPYLARSIADDGIDLIRSAWYDPAKVTDEIVAGYKKPLLAENWDRALFEATLFGSARDLPGRLSKLSLPVLVITGDSDTWVPTEQSVRLAGEIPHAHLAVLPRCGHVPQEECPQAFMQAVSEFLNDLN